MGNSSVESKKQNRKLYYIFALIVVLIVVVVVAFFGFQNPAFQDPLLYNNAITVQVVTDKTFKRACQMHDINII